MRDLVYLIATSIDGFIAGPDGDVSHFPAAADTVAELFSRYPETCPVHLRTALGVTAAPRRFDTVILGRRTHAPAVAAGLAGGAYPHLRQILVTHHAEADSAGTEVITGDIVAHVRALKAKPGRDIWLCGGAEVSGELVDLIDEVQLKINPILLGDGIPLLRTGVNPRAFVPVGFEPLPGGVTLATFRADRATPAAA